jgi:hypothetical protein
MPNYYVENAEKWKVLANIDYFTHFVKAWIPFNAWYRNSYTALDSDAEIMQAIKTTHNRFKDKLVALIEGPLEDNESRIFKMHLSDLHYHLERCPIHNTGERVSFLNLVVERNAKTIETMTYRNFVYKVEIDPANMKKISTTILDKKAATRLLIVQTNGYDVAEVEGNLDYQKLPPELKAKTRACYQAVNPRRPACLLTTNASDCIDVGSYHFINNADLIAKAVITVVYSLRNALFHGQIIPDRDTQRVYEPAYHILSMLVMSLS